MPHDPTDDQGDEAGPERVAGDEGVDDVIQDLDCSIGLLKDSLAEQVRIDGHWVEAFCC